MFTQTRLKLTLYYSLLFLSLLWVFSGIVYLWMGRSLGEGYTSQVQQRRLERLESQEEIDDEKLTIIATSGDIALEQLLTIVLAINGIALIFVPAVSWYLAEENLAPIQSMYEKQKQFVSDASHELKTPLSIMQGEIDVALKKKRTPNEYKIILESSKQELNRLTTLVKNLLFLAKEDQNKYLEKPEEIDITDNLATLLSQLKPLYKKKKLKVIFKPADESVVVKGSSILVRQLFFNLLENAIKYTEEGSISVEISSSRKQAKIVIADTGIGMSSEERAKLFQRFYRVDQSRSEEKGYGLGLAICQTVIQKLHGHIAIHSTPGKGTSVIVLLPRSR